MPYVIGEECIDVKDRSCIDICPVDCIYELRDGRLVTPEGNEHEAAEGVDPRQLYINPSECIDCGACEDVCPVEAISLDQMLPPDQQHVVWKNRDAFASARPSHARFGHR
jgi:NAD-dependent dihydropyrimidine dehydrogenase PreA subunit